MVHDQGDTGLISQARYRCDWRLVSSNPSSIGIRGKSHLYVRITRARPLPYRLGICQEAEALVWPGNVLFPVHLHNWMLYKYARRDDPLAHKPWTEAGGNIGCQVSRSGGIRHVTDARIPTSRPITGGVLENPTVDGAAR